MSSEKKQRIRWIPGLGVHDEEKPGEYVSPDLFVERLNELIEERDEMERKWKNSRSSLRHVKSDLKKKVSALSARVEALTEERDALEGLGEIVRDEYADYLHTRADYHGYDAKPIDWLTCAINTLQPAAQKIAALTARVSKLEAALRAMLAEAPKMSGCGSVPGFYDTEVVAEAKCALATQREEPPDAATEPLKRASWQTRKEWDEALTKRALARRSEKDDDIPCLKCGGRGITNEWIGGRECECVEPATPNPNGLQNRYLCELDDDEPVPGQGEES